MVTIGHKPPAIDIGNWFEHWSLAFTFTTTLTSATGNVHQFLSLGPLDISIRYQPSATSVSPWHQEFAIDILQIVIGNRAK